MNHNERRKRSMARAASSIWSLVGVAWLGLVACEGRTMEGGTEVSGETGGASTSSTSSIGGGDHSGGAPNDLAVPSAPGSCGVGTYDADPGEGLDCKPIPTCPPGTFQVSVRCEPCPEKTFSITENARECHPWTSCGFGRQESIAPTITSDRSCRDADQFPLFGHANGLSTVFTVPAIVATSQYVYVAADWEIARYTIAGAPLDPWPVGSEFDTRIEDLAKIGEDLLVASTEEVFEQGTNLHRRMASLERLDANGVTAWRHTYSEPVPLLGSVRIVVRGERIYLAAYVMNSQCTVDPAGGVVCQGQNDPTFVLRVHKSDGTIELSKASSEPLVGFYDFEVTSDERIFVAAARTIPNQEERIADLDPVLDSLEYPEAVDSLGNPVDVIMEFDSAGEFVRDYPVRNLFNDPVQLVSDDAGFAYALVGPYALTNKHPSRAYLVRFAQGMRTEQVEVNLTWGDWPRRMTRAGDGFAFVGRDLNMDASVFAKFDASGNILLRKVMDQFDSSTALVEAPNGTLFIGGRSNALAFAAPWPE